MSTIDKLHIMGIRNFGPEERDKAIIKFSTPLTIILGQNGCGKTTIIEALKYAACGEIPAGTDSGSGFVHDPELANSHMVRGQVKLRCRNTKGEFTTVVRTVQVTRKVKKMEFKTLDSTISVGDKSVSERCADIDAVMCHNLGVSKAVLTNVIFCHQEDSAWPLEKGKKIKERFDAIFGITEYNKCLDYLRTLAKEKGSKLEVLKSECQYKGKYRSDAEEKRKKLSEEKCRLTAIHDQIDELNNKREPIERQMKDLRQKQQNYVTYAAKVDGMKNRRKLIMEQIDSFKESIEEEYGGSKEELLREIASFDEELRNKKNRLNNSTEEKQSALREEKRVQNDINVKQMFLGNLQSNDQQNTNNVINRNHALRNLADELGAPIVSNSQLNETNSGESLKIVEDKVKEQAKYVEKMQENQENVEKSLQKKIDDAFEKKARLETDIKTKTRIINESKDVMKKIKKEIDEVNRSSEGLGDLAKKMEALNKEKEDVANSFNDEQCRTEMKLAENEIENLDRKLATLYDEIQLLQKVSLQREKLDSLNKRKSERDAEFHKMKQKHSSSLQHLLGFIPDHDFRSVLEKKLKKTSEEIRSIEKSINEKEINLTGLNTRKSNVDEQLKQKRRKCAEDESEIEELCRNKHIDVFIEEVNKQIAESQEIKGTVSASKFLFTKYIDKLKSADPLCPVCGREFDDSSDIEPVIKQLENRIKEIPKKEEETQNALTSLTARQATAMELKHKHNNLQAVRNNEIPKLSAEAKSIKEAIDSVQAELDAQRLELVGPQSDKTMIDELLSDATLMDQCQKEMKPLEREINEVESKLPSTVSSKTLEEANKELEVVRSKLSSLRKKQDENQKKLSKYNETIKKINDEQNTIAAKQLQIAGSVQKCKSLEERLSELEKSEADAIAERNRAEMQLNPVESEHKELKEKLSHMKIDHKRLIAEKKRKLVDYEKKVDEIRKLQAAVDEYNKSGGAGRCKTTRSELAELQLRKKEIETRKEELEKEREKTTDFLNKQEMKRFNLNNTLNLLKKKDELIQVEKEIQELEGDTEVIDVDQLQKDLDKFDKERRGLELQKSNASGRAAELQSIIRDLERELNKSEYKNADDEYRKSYVNLMVASKAIEDIKEYEKGMDWVMIHFHQDRMKKINEAVRELWRNIYQGNDIDWIAIKTDEGAHTAAGKRNYNYKVVQVKNNVELEMPGRCSAGQKVLACLIIRIALAETFSKNCGILALDEPTTNLDKENSESLAATLAELVERRSTQRNFQLVVITHDKDFIDKICRIEKVEHYIEVSRNNSGKSQAIKREVY